MEVVENLIKTTLEEVEKMLSTKTVVGEPITVEGGTIIPLISIGFGFGAAGGSGKGEAKQRGEGAGGGTVGGAWVRPKAVIIVDKEGVRIEPIKGGISTTMEKISVTIPEMIEKAVENWGQRKKDG